MQTNYELQRYTERIYEQVSFLSGFSGYISNSEALELVQKARRCKKLSNGGDNEQLIHCLNEETKELEYVRINHKSSVTKFLTILICDAHYISKQQINKVLIDLNLTK